MKKIAFLLLFLLSFTSKGTDIPSSPDMFVCTFGHNQENWCEKNEEMWFAIKVRNIWDEIQINVVVTNHLDYLLMEYVSGSAVYATIFDEEWQVNEADWILIPDDDGFPLENGYQIFTEMKSCFEEDDKWKLPYLCHKGALIRYKVKLRLPSSYAIVNNIAEISSDEMLAPYKTNLGIPMRLTYDGNCEDSIDMTLCGGDGAEQESEDSDVLPDDDSEVESQNDSACSVVVIP